MQAVFLVAVEMAGRGFIVSPTARNAFGADLLATDASCNRAFSVQVKANRRSKGFWLLSKNAKALIHPSHVYVFVNLRGGAGGHEFYVVPSSIVARRMIQIDRLTGTTWYYFERKHAAKFKDTWDVFDRDSVPRK